jgi:hypothetical protein
MSPVVAKVQSARLVVYISSNQIMVSSFIKASVLALLIIIRLWGRITSFGRDEKRMRKGLEKD